MKINGVKLTAKKFAYDGCHKIYLLDNKQEISDAKEMGYGVIPIEELKDVYENSCSLRFISGWKPDFKSYVAQFEEAEWKET